jgi:Mn2+/Fe2+ NRAMP family transporter
LGANRREISDRFVDVATGTFISSLVMFSIMLTTALTLYQSGTREITTSRQAAEGLRPLAGNGASLLFTIGILGTGFLAIPTLAGSAAYAFADTFRWRQGLDENFGGARSFYGVFLASIGVGVALDFLGVSAIHALYWSAVVNGILAPFLLFGVLMVACDRKLMAAQPSSMVSRIVVALTVILMFGAAVAMFVL